MSRANLNLSVTRGLSFVLILTTAALANAQVGQNALLIPPALTGPEYNLNMARGSVQFLPGNTTPTAGYNGNILGPTLIMSVGDRVTLNVTNNLGEDTTTHWHGMHVKPQDDGGPHTVIPNGTTWSPSFRVRDTASTMWYHPHLHEHTFEQVNLGLAGMILIRDNVETNAGLPMTYGVDEFPLIVQDKSFTGNNSFGGGGLGNVYMINGTLDPFLNVPSQMVRFRVLNASANRAYNIGFSDNRAYAVVGADGGLLEAPTNVTRTAMMPGERIDIVVNFSGNNGSSVNLMNFANSLANTLPGGNGGPGGGPGPNINGVDASLLEFRVGAQTASPVTTLPANIWTLDRLHETNATVTRTIELTGGGGGNPFSLDNQAYNGSRMDQTVLLDTTEIWTLVNRGGAAHPFHIHDIQFFILDRNREPIAPHETGKKDTVIVHGNETVRFIAHFPLHNDTEVPYMYHCHILPHEDGGMMGQFIVVNPAAQLVDLTPGATDLTLRWSKNLGPGIFNLQSSGVINSTFTNITINPTLVNDRNQIIWNIDRAARFFQLKPVP
jgi:FtsP/CotA-like multicopper oxidase with cupredoxin domain